MQLTEHLAKMTYNLEKQKYLLQVQCLRNEFKYISNSNTFAQHKTGLFISTHISIQCDHACFFRAHLAGETFFFSMLALLKTAL